MPWRTMPKEDDIRSTLVGGSQGAIENDTQHTEIL
jgi:hypothetical protein